MKWLELLKTLAPVILSTITGVPPAIIPLVAHGLTEAEGLKGASGTEKKAHVLNLVQDGIIGLNAAKGSTVLDPHAVVEAVGQGIDTTVAAVNIVHSVHAPTP